MCFQGSSLRHLRVSTQAVQERQVRQAVRSLRRWRREARAKVRRLWRVVCGAEAPRQGGPSVSKVHRERPCREVRTRMQGVPQVVRTKAESGVLQPGMSGSWRQGRSQSTPGNKVLRGMRWGVHIRILWCKMLQHKMRTATAATGQEAANLCRLRNSVSHDGWLATKRSVLLPRLRFSEHFSMEHQV